MRYLAPGETFTALLQGAPEGIADELGVKAIDIDTGTTVVAHIAAGGASGVVEQDAPSGLYRRPGLVAPSTAVVMQIVWDHATVEIADSELYEVTYTESPPAPLSPSYTTPPALRDELGVNDTILPDAAALRLIADAEDAIDSLLGIPTSDMDPTGRKVDADDVEDWQFTKLSRATVKLAALFHRDPQLLAGRSWESVSGPDFSFSGQRGSVVGPQILTLLNDSGLRNLASRATPGIGGGRALARKFFTTGQPRW